MDLDAIDFNLFLGWCPDDSEDVERLRKEYGITAVLNVQTDDDLTDWGIDWDGMQRAYEEAGIVLRREPVTDFDPEALRQRLPDCVRALAELLDENHTVYVHCSAGINRSPTTVVAYFHRCRGWDLDRAVRHVLMRRSCDPLIQAILTADWDGTGRG